MKFLILTVFLSLAVLCHVKASSSFDDSAREQLWDLLRSEQAESLSSSDDLNDELERRDKSYLTAEKHPERLRLCVKCVGKEREKGKNVKQSVSHCNKICRRGLFDTRSLYLNDLLEERDLF